MKKLSQAGRSVLKFLELIFSWSLHTSNHHIRQQYKAPDNKTYAVFRETSSDKEYEQQEVTLIIGFRLALIDSNRFFHWLFQRLSIFDTPIWVGFTGFKRKFWMVELETKDYLGMYRYQGKENAHKYAEYICAVLRPVSTPSSVWYKIVEEEFGKYIDRNKV